MRKTNLFSSLPFTLITVAVTAFLSSIDVQAADIGDKMPACKLTALEAPSVANLEQFRGKIVYLDFWASWCPPCVKSFPFMNELTRDFKTQGVEVIAVNLDESAADAQEFINHHDVQFSVATDESKACAQAFAVKAMPSTYLIDRKGVIRHIHLGFRDEAAQELKKNIERLLSDEKAANHS